MDPEAANGEISRVVEELITAGVGAVVVRDGDRQVVVAARRGAEVDTSGWRDLPGVDRLVETVGHLRLVSRHYRPVGSVVNIGGVEVGGNRIVVAAGPCAVESREQLMATAEAVARAGARVLRGDAFKPRTSPYAFQGLGEDGLKMLADARDETGLPFVAEVLDPRDVELVASYADLVRIGTRNMSNYALLREVGRQSKPVQLKRGRTATIDEWLSAAEYIYTEGNPNIVLVERGIRTFEPSVRNTLDISAVPIAKDQTHLPVMVDPSHAGGRRDLIGPLSLAALAAGADGLLIDVHINPAHALVDGDQALEPKGFADLVVRLRTVAAAMGREL